MKKSIFILLLVFSVSTTFAQKNYNMKDVPLKFSIPNNLWLSSNQSKTEKGVIWHFKRLNTKDSLGKKTTPELVIIAENIPADLKLTEYSQTKQKPYQTLKNYKAEKIYKEGEGKLRLHYSVGYLASYEEQNGAKHTFYFIHAIKEGKGIQIIINISSNIFAYYKDELTDLLISFE